MQETIQLKSNEECFSITINLGSQGLGAGLHEKARRISIYHNGTGNQKNYNYSMDPRFSHIRSLMMFQLVEFPPRSFGDKFFRAFRLIRVLDLKGAGLVEFPPELVELIHLRYLSLRGTPINLLPKSVGELMNLETLDLKQTCVSELPVEILKLQRLRHLLVHRYESNGASGVSVPTGRIGNLTCLQKLVYLDVQHHIAGRSGEVVLLKELGKLTQLTKLGITNLRREDGRDLCLALKNMEHLTNLKLIAMRINNEEEEFLELGSLMSSPPQLLRHLCLHGCLSRLPVWIASLRNLTSLSLQYSRLSCEEDDPLKAFQHLPNLMCLLLEDAYEGEELCCSEVGGYTNLKILLLEKMEGLKRVRFMKESMPMLRELEIQNCSALEMVPHGIEHLSGLQELILFEMNPELVDRIRKRRPKSLPPVQGEAQLSEGKVSGGEDCWKVQHIPKIKHIYVDNTQGEIVDENLN